MQSMFSGDTTDFVVGLRASRSLDVGRLAFETLTPSTLDEASADVAQLIRKLEAARVALAGVRHTRRTGATRPPDPAPAADDTPPPPPPVDDKAARQATRLAEALREMPHTRAAFESGRLSTEQVNQLTRLAADQSVRPRVLAGELGLVEAAIAAGPDRTGEVIRDRRSRAGAAIAKRDAKARHRARSTRTWTDDNGFSHLHFSGADAYGAEAISMFRQLLDRDWTQKLTRADGPIDERTREQRAADTFVMGLRLATSALSTGVTTPRPRTSLLVKVDYDDLVAAAGSGTELITGASVSAADIHKLCCDAGIARIVTDGDSVPLDKGREARLATDHQRRTLAALYSTCGRPGCRVPFSWTEIHHIDGFVADLGETNIDDLLPGCSVHHHDLHHGGHRIERGERRGEKIWVTPDGQRHPIRPSPPLPRARPPDPAGPAQPRPRPRTADDQLSLLQT